MTENTSPATTVRLAACNLITFEKLKRQRRFGLDLCRFYFCVATRLSQFNYTAQSFKQVSRFTGGSCPAKFLDFVLSCFDPSCFDFVDDEPFASDRRPTELLAWLSFTQDCWCCRSFAVSWRLAKLGQLL